LRVSNRWRHKGEQQSQTGQYDQPPETGAVSDYLFRHATCSQRNLQLARYAIAVSKPCRRCRRAQARA
jgi:hypothetical protein